MTYAKAEKIQKQKSFTVFLIIGLIYCIVAIIPAVIFTVLYIKSNEKNKNYIKAIINTIGKIGAIIQISIMLIIAIITTCQIIKIIYNIH